MWTAGSGLICSRVACIAQQIVPSRPRQHPARRLQSSVWSWGGLAWGRIWPSITDVVVVRDELGEQLCVWEQGWVVLFLQSAVLHLSVICFRFVFCPRLASFRGRSHGSLSVRLGASPVTRYSSEIITCLRLWNIDMIAKLLQLHVIYNVKLLTRSNVPTLFHVSKKYFR